MDDFFAGKDDYVVDECLTFMAASTQTTTMLVFNAIDLLVMNKDKLQRLREDLFACLQVDSPKIL